MRHHAASALLLATLVSCRSTPPMDIASTQKVLDSLLARHGQHAVREDIDAVLGLYTDDIVLRANHREPIRGGVIALWVRDSAGGLRIHRDVVNSSTPIPTPAR